MGKEERRALIREIETLTNGRLICYITGDRRGLETRIAGDTIPLIYDHLRGIGPVPRINVFIYTAGGDSLAGWAMVSLVREFCDTLGVIIPFRALSCGTLIALGADELIMAKGAQLSPVDPSLASPYNPPAPGQIQPAVQLLPVSVEDVIGYLKLAREEAGIKGDEGISKIMTVLSEKVHPMALGAVYRSREQIRLLARKLLTMHEKDQKKIEKLVDMLTKELPSHQYLISRKEAKGEFGLKVSESSGRLDELIWNLYKDYEQQLQLNVPYNPEAVLGPSGSSSTATFDRAVIESLKEDGSSRTQVFRTEKEIRRVQSTQPGIPFPMVGIQERNIVDQWVEV